MKPAHALYDIQKCTNNSHRESRQLRKKKESPISKEESPRNIQCEKIVKKPIGKRSNGQLSCIKRGDCFKHRRKRLLIAPPIQSKAQVTTNAIKPTTQPTREVTTLASKERIDLTKSRSRLSNPQIHSSKAMIKPPKNAQG